MLASLLTFTTCITVVAGPIAAISGMPATAQFAFEQHQIATGSALRQTVLTGFLLGGAIADLAVLHIDDNGEHRLRIYAFDDSTWAPRLDTALASEVLFIDIAHIGGRDRLLTYRPGRLHWFDPESASERPLVAVSCNFNPPRSGEIPHVDLTRDVNGDDRDDLVVPDVDGFRVLIQMDDSTFAEPIQLGPATDMSRIYGADGYRYDPWSQSRIHEIDYEQDGRRDLAFWNQDHFEIHLQDEHGLLAAVAETFTTDVAFDSDDLCSLATGDLTGRVLHSFTDLNGDGIGDLVIHSLAGSSISSKHSTYQVHLGTAIPEGGTAFTRSIARSFDSDGSIQLGMDRHDFDRDGQVDLLLTSIEIDYLESSLFKRFAGFMGDDIWLNLRFYRLADGLYPDAANATRRIQLDGAPSPSEPGWIPLDIVLRGGTHERRKTQKGYLRAFNRTLLIGDVTGDGRSDLLIEWTYRELRVYAGVPGPELFARQPQKIAVTLPNDEEYTWLVDLNKDGKQDILMHHPSTNGPQRITTLIAQ